MPASLSWLAFFPLAMGFLSLLLGQDANWDFRNYHHYNPFALLNGRLGIDLLPAGLQTYLNPSLDVPYFWLQRNFPPMVAGFAMGAFQGLCGVFAWRIAAHVLPPSSPARLPLLLALAGCFGPVFLSELGNTMGDNTTAVFVLGSLWMVLHWRARIEEVQTARAAWQRAFFLCGAAGTVAGLGVGLKLTNGPLAVGLLAAVATLAGPPAWRLLRTAAFGVGVLLGTAVTAGYWLATVWRLFGNPLFPQFNSIFHSPLAAPMGVADRRWVPQGAGEAILFPFVFTFWPERFGEVPTIQLLSPVAYGAAALLLVAVAVPWWRRRLPAAPPAEAARNQQLLLAFLATSYLAWMAVFSIGRYTVAMELLLPLAVWVLLHRLARPGRAHRLATVFIGGAVAFAVVKGANWGRAGWADGSFSVKAPVIEQPGTATVLLPGSPVSWVLPHFPPEVAFVGIRLIAETDAYHRRAMSILDKRGGALYALFPAELDTLERSYLKLNERIANQGINSGDSACDALRWLVPKIPRFRKAAIPAATSGSGPGGACSFALPHGGQRDMAAAHLGAARTHALQMAASGLYIDLHSCTIHPAFIGDAEYPYQFCRVQRRPAPR